MTALVGESSDRPYREAAAAERDSRFGAAARALTLEHGGDHRRAHAHVARKLCERIFEPLGLLRLPLLRGHTASGSARAEFHAGFGNGGQRLYVLPEVEPVVVITASLYDEFEKSNELAGGVMREVLGVVVG